MMKHYTRIMFVHLVNDYVMTFAFFIILPEIFPLNGQVYLLIGNYGEKLELEWCRWLICIYYFAEILQLVLLPVDFYYRYRVVCKQEIMSDRKLYSIITALTLTVFCQTVVLTQYTLKQNPEYNEILKHALNSTSVPVYLATITDPILAHTPLLMNIFFVLFCYSMCVYVFWAINKVLRKNTANSKTIKALKIEKQVTRLMIVQCVLPMFVISLPVLVTCGFTLLKLPLLEIGPINQIVIAWNGAIKTVATIIVIPNYELMGASASVAATSDGRHTKSVF
uniref:G_PROTEIN_RECEP_F1_2 domain-containing protein n=1 Tax=Bursaphelenchus xylophilus TaxID=6326 RepID=A0A1I7S7S0_BURXY